MKSELIVLVLALALVALRAWLGWRKGAAVEIRFLLSCAFGMLAALRFWYQATAAVGKILPVDGQILAPVVFIALFAAAFALAAFLVGLRGESFRSVRENRPDRILGAICGGLGGLILGACLVLLSTLALPGRVADFNPENLPARLDRLPGAFYRSVEHGVAGVPDDSAARTPLPLAVTSTDSAGQYVQVFWK